MRPLQVDLSFHDVVKQAPPAGYRSFLRLGSFDILDHLDSNSVAQPAIIGILPHLPPCPILRGQVILVLGVQLGVLVFKLSGLGLVRHPPGLSKDIPAIRCDTADLSVIPLRYDPLIEPPEVRPKEHESVGRTRRISIFTLTPAALGMEIGRGKLALIGKPGQELDGLSFEGWLEGYGRGGRILGEWLRGLSLDGITTTRGTLVQTCDRESSVAQLQCSFPSKSRWYAPSGRVRVESLPDLRTAHIGVA